MKKYDEWWFNKRYKADNGAAALCSGGIDSTVMMYYLAKRGAIQEVITIDSGQAAVKHQRELVKFHAAKNGLKTTTLKVKIPYGANRTEITEIGFKPRKRKDLVDWVNLSKHSDDEGRKYTKDEFAWIEGRNALWLLHAAIYATTKDIERLFVGFQFDRPRWKCPSSLNGDTSPAFVSDLNSLFDNSFMKYVDVVAPFLEMKLDKEDITKFGRELGIPLSNTYSCEFYPPCGYCFQCQMVARLKKRGLFA